MTAQELIQLLQTLPPHTKMVVLGYEDGYNDILRLNEVKIKPKADAVWYYGEYVDTNDSEGIIALDLFGVNQRVKDDLI